MLFRSIKHLKREPRRVGVFAVVARAVACGSEHPHQPAVIMNGGDPGEPGMA